MSCRDLLDNYLAYYNTVLSMSEPKPINVEVSGTVDSIAITELTIKMTFQVEGHVYREETFCERVNIPIKEIPKGV